MEIFLLFKEAFKLENLSKRVAIASIILLDKGLVDFLHTVNLVDIIKRKQIEHKNKSKKTDSYNLKKNHFNTKRLLSELFTLTNKYKA